MPETPRFASVMMEKSAPKLVSTRRTAVRIMANATVRRPSIPAKTIRAKASPATMVPASQQQTTLPCACVTAITFQTAIRRENPSVSNQMNQSSQTIVKVLTAQVTVHVSARRVVPSAFAKTAISRASMQPHISPHAKNPQSHRPPNAMA